MAAALIQSPPTTPERRLLCLLARGQTSSEAAAALGLTLADTERILADLLRRFGVSSPRRLFVHALVHRWI